MTASDPYQILGVARGASDDAVRKAYKVLARSCHPDVNPGDKQAEERFKEVSEAYATLSDPEKRQAFDQFGRAGGRSTGGIRWEDLGGSGFDFGGRGVSFRDLFARVVGGDGGPTRPRARPRRGESLQTVVRISFMDALHGLTVPITISRQVSCATCGAPGAHPGSHDPNVSDCPTCKGERRQARVDTLQLKVPAGIVDGTRMKVAGKGNDDAGGAGDLLVRVRVAAHPVFERRGDNIACKVPVTVAEAALGARIQVPTIDGSARLSVPPGTPSGQQLRLRGKGAPSRGGGRGDQLVEIEVLVPDATDADTRELLERLGEHLDSAPRDHLFGRSG